jgi:paraquat-inducible protein B
MTPVKPALVGGFVLGGLILAVIAVLLVAGTHLFSRQMHAVTYFGGSVAGLTVGAPVTFRGVRVGSVTRIGVNIDMKSLTARIPVYLDLDTSDIAVGGRDNGAPWSVFRSLRKAGLQAQLSMQSLVTGQLGVDLDFRPGVRGTYLGGDVGGNEIPSSASKMQTLEAEIAELPLKEIAEDARQTLVSMKRVADELGPRVGPMVDSLKRTSESAHVTMDAAHVAVDHIDGLAVEGKRQLTVDGPQLATVLTSSDRTVRDADALVTSLNKVTGPDSRIRDDLQAATRDLAASASSLRTFSHEIERNPSDLIRRGKPQ